LDAAAVDSVLKAAGHRVAKRPRELPAGLTDRELEVLLALAAGKTNKEIAETLGISPGTVKRYLSDGLAKMAIALADDGTVGWGEAVTSWPDVCRATEAMIEGISAELVVGRDPLDNVDIWRRGKQRAWWYGNRGGVSSFALSAIDIALWDLKGKLLGVPVTRLLGGAHHERLRAIASTHPRDASLEVEADRHAGYIRDLGFQGCKFGLGKKGDAGLGRDDGA